VRRTTAVRSAVAAALALTIGLGGLAACSGNSSAKSTASPSATSAPTAAATGAATASPADFAAVDKITVTGDASSKPTITLPSKPFSVSGPVVKLLSPGTGAALSDGTIIQFHSVAVQGSDGTEGQSSYGAAPETVAISSTGLNADLYKALSASKVGARVLMAVPSTSSGSTIVGVIDVIGTVPSRAAGTAVTPPAGLPTVKLDDKGAPTLTPVKTAAPTSLVVQPLIQGSGATVASGQSITVQYSGWLWDGTPFDSSWTKGTPLSGLTIGQNQVIKGWDQGLVGQKVGSQVLLVIPPDLGYGDKAQGSIPANSTLVFVVDILAAG